MSIDRSSSRAVATSARPAASSAVAATSPSPSGLRWSRRASTHATDSPPRAAHAATHSA
jgi:hypothetical protein